MDATKQIRIQDGDDTGGGETPGRSEGNAIPNALTRGVGRGLAGLVTMAVIVGVHFAAFSSAHPPRGCAGWGDFIQIFLDWGILGVTGFCASGIVALLPVRTWLAAVVAGMLTIGASLPVHSILCTHPRCGWGDVALRLPGIGPRLEGARRPVPGRN